MQDSQKKRQCRMKMPGKRPREWYDRGHFFLDVHYQK